ncbi:hypothetical protein H6G06_23430 [Anabaena sphaerica FACHB-251]|uniref:Uncharacterized protein n=1 Tax=Anabaena sphaerica FACHB-251 TaxID=2692883 RepID=A0A926WNF3_9NOST|nr:hypothetical protein [Anabaena sphaerica]MBD2296353.1 hypothetical protein [Anabaena sphaerica FACHB-251]
MYINKIEKFVLQKIEKLENQISSLEAENQSMKARLTYLEYDLHTENQRLTDENFYFRQEVDYSSEEYCANEDSWQREYSS